MYIDLFAGCGGLSLGLQNAGWEALFAIEKNEDAFSTLRQNLIVNRGHFHWPDWLPQANLDINEVLEKYEQQLRQLRGQVQLLVGGPPCQGFSMAGKRTGNDARNKLYNSYIKFVETIQPEMLFFENVHGFTVGFKRKYRGKDTKGEPYSQKLIKQLKKLGYQVEYKVVLMSDFGVPQNRKRFILFATRTTDPKLFFKLLYDSKEPFLKEKNIEAPVNVEQAIGDLERVYGEVISKDSSRFMNGVYGPIQFPYQQLMRDKVAANAIPDSHRFARPKEETVQLFQRLMDATQESVRITPKMGLVDGLKKRGVTPLKRRCICPTVTSIPDDFIHYSEPRIMTVRECARIQSFPDDYVFLGKYTTGGERRKYDVPRYTQVANAVPPLFAEQVGLVLREIMNHE